MALSYVLLISFAYTFRALNYNEIQVRGSYNSYHQLNLNSTIPEWLYQQKPLLDQALAGIRWFELSPRDSNGTFDVYYYERFDNGSECGALNNCLEPLRNWSSNNSDALFFFLKPLPRFNNWDALETNIKEVWGLEDIYTPDMLRGTAGSLQEALGKLGFPSLAELKGKAIFLVDFVTAVVNGYYQPIPPYLKNRLFFPVEDVSSYNVSYVDADSIFVTVGVQNDTEAFKQKLEETVRSQKALVRVPVDIHFAPTGVKNYSELSSVYFRLLDYNNSGDVSLDEFVAAVEWFPERVLLPPGAIAVIWALCVTSQGKQTATIDSFACIDQLGTIFGQSVIPAQYSLEKTLELQNITLNSGAHFVITKFPFLNNITSYFLEWPSNTTYLCNTITAANCSCNSTTVEPCP
eukprot:TRINITY_DN14053_c0_g1_i1.p1 TRINITY_DN14053_c0_g1~~TRINITY_DN14053_c0_g1_i1.p1  ORF type:complete len:406 (-),score=68.88 TRINITY_DN14053_c0_g1_i1:7-1224(-)